jgi:hypothetical protein
MMFIVEEPLKLSSIASQSLVFQGSLSLRNKRSHCLQMFPHLLASADTVSVLDDEQDTAMLIARFLGERPRRRLRSVSIVAASSELNARHSSKCNLMRRVRWLDESPHRLEQIPLGFS